MVLDSSAFRRISGHFATGVTVITTAVADQLHGMTANAFMSVSLEPLLILVSIDRKAHAHEQVDRAGRFCVNLLSESQEELSTLFAVTAPPEEGRLRGAAYHTSPTGMLVLDGCLAYMECEVRERFAGGDHTLFLSQVLDGELTSEAGPLIFYQAKYRTLEL